MTKMLPDRNWEVLLGLLPRDWEELAWSTQAVRRRRGFKSVELLLRGLLVHVGLGCSLRETAVVTKAAGWLEMSDVALLKKLRMSEEWLRQLCVGLVRESAMAVPAGGAPRMRLVDATMVHEPGRTGSQWRVHYSMRVPDWVCDHFELSASDGEGNGESLRHFPVRAGDCLIADRGYAHAAGIAHVHRNGGKVIVRHHPQALPLRTTAGAPLQLLEWLAHINEPGQLDGCEARLDAPQGPIPVRICAVRKSVEATLASQRKLKRRAQRKGQRLRQESLDYAQWVIVLTTLRVDELEDVAVMEWYRVRWQVELAFKRLKSLADFGHLPKSDPASSRAWLYGKLLVALLTEKMQRYAAAFSPWGGRCGQIETDAESMA